MLACLSSQVFTEVAGLRKPFYSCMFNGQVYLTCRYLLFAISGYIIDSDVSLRTCHRRRQIVLCSTRPTSDSECSALSSTTRPADTNPCFGCQQDRLLLLRAGRCLRSCRSQWSSGSMPDCSARGPGIESRCGQLRLSHNHCDLQPWARAVCTFPAVPRSTQPSTLRGTVNEYQLSG